MIRIAAAALVTLLAGCAAQAAGPSASVDVNALVRAHPLYGTLAQYDRQIAALRATMHAPEFSHKQQAFANASSAVRKTLAQSASRTQQVAAMPSPDVRALQDDGNVRAPSERSVRSDMQHAYSDQASQLHAQAQQSMNQFRAHLLAQQQTAFDDYVRTMHARVQQAYASREQELYEKEQTLALDLAKADAGKRLAIRAKLHTLVLDDATRRSLQAQMNALQQREDLEVAAQRKRDRAKLAAFLPPLQAKADADVARMHAELERRTAANLAARERVLAAQNATSAARLNLGATANPASKPGDMQGRLQHLLAAKAADPSAFLTAREDLTKQFSGISAADREATQSTKAQIAALRTARSQLYNDIVSQIMRDAQVRARARGLSGAYAASKAPAGSVDLTNLVRSDLSELTR